MQTLQGSCTTIFDIHVHEWNCSGHYGSVLQMHYSLCTVNPKIFVSTNFCGTNFRVKKISDSSVCPKMKTPIISKQEIFVFLIFGVIRKYFYTENFRIYGITVYMQWGLLAIG